MQSITFTEALSTTKEILNDDMKGTRRCHNFKCTYNSLY